MNKFFYEFDDIAPVEVAPGFVSKLIHTGHQTLNFIEVEAGHSIPLHHHAEEQMSFVLEGQFEMTIDGTAMVLDAGRFCHIPSHVVHAGRALTRCRLVDVFSPGRADYREKGGIHLE